MRFELDTSSGTKNIILRYEPGLVTVNQETYSQSLIISPKQIILNWEVTEILDFGETQWQPFLDLNVTTVLLGLGDSQMFIHGKWLEWFAQKHIGVEVMINRSACYTYNALVAEGRNVALGLVL